MKSISDKSINLKLIAFLPILIALIIFLFKDSLEYWFYFFVLEIILALILFIYLKRTYCLEFDSDNNLIRAFSKDVEYLFPLNEVTKIEDGYVIRLRNFNKRRNFLIKNLTFRVNKGQTKKIKFIVAESNLEFLKNYECLKFNFLTLRKENFYK